MLFAKTMATHDAVHYPDRLHKLYIVNAPSIFPPAWEFISMLLDEEVSHHVHLLSGEHSWRPMLEAAMDPSILPKSMGGTFTTSVQVPGLCPLTIPKPSPPEPAEPAPAPKALAREQERSLLASKAAKARAPVHAPSPASRPAPATAMSSGAAGPVPPDQCQAPSHGASSSSSSTEPDGLDGLTRDPTVEVAAGHGIHVDTAAEHQSAAADAPAAGKWNLATDAAAPIATPTATPDIAMSAAEVSAMEAAEVTAMEGLEEIMAPDEMDAQMEYALSELPAEFGGGFGGFVHTPQQEERQERVASHGVSATHGDSAAQGSSGMGELLPADVMGQALANDDLPYEVKRDPSPEYGEDLRQRMDPYRPPPSRVRGPLAPPTSLLSIRMQAALAATATRAYSTNNPTSTGVLSGSSPSSASVGSSPSAGMGTPVPSLRSRPDRADRRQEESPSEWPPGSFTLEWARDQCLPEPTRQHKGLLDHFFPADYGQEGVLGASTVSAFDNFLAATSGDGSGMGGSGWQTFGSTFQGLFASLGATDADTPPNRRGIEASRDGSIA